MRLKSIDLLRKLGKVQGKAEIEETTEFGIEEGLHTDAAESRGCAANAAQAQLL